MNTPPVIDVPRDKADALERIHRSWLSLEEAIARLEAGEMQVPGPEGWSIKDHLAHLTTWELGIVELLHKRARFEAMGVQEAVSNGRSEDEINDLIFRRRANRTAADVLAYFAEVHDRMVDVLRSMDDEDLMRPYSSFLPEGATGSEMPVIGWIVGNTYAHYDEHRRTIQALLGSMEQAPGETGEG